jgi:hypothetical protein
VCTMGSVGVYAFVIPKNIEDDHRASKLIRLNTQTHTGMTTRTPLGSLRRFLLQQLRSRTGRQIFNLSVDIEYQDSAGESETDLDARMMSAGKNTQRVCWRSDRRDK